MRNLYSKWKWCTLINDRVVSAQTVLDQDRDRCCGGWEHAAEEQMKRKEQQIHQLLEVRLVRRTCCTASSAGGIIYTRWCVGAGIWRHQAGLVVRHNVIWLERHWTPVLSWFACAWTSFSIAKIRFIRDHVFLELGLYVLACQRQITVNMLIFVDDLSAQNHSQEVPTAFWVMCTPSGIVTTTWSLLITENERRAV